MLCVGIGMGGDRGVKGQSGVEVSILYRMGLCTSTMGTVDDAKLCHANTCTFVEGVGD